MNAAFRNPQSALPNSEAEVRQLRDQVFGAPSTDRNWEACRENWLRPESVAWLIEKTQATPATP